MFKNHLKITFRNLLRNKSFSLINLTGLGLGLAVFILIMLWVNNEINYDNFHKDADRIAAIMSAKKFKTGEVQSFPAVPPPLASAIQKDLPSVEYAATVSWGDVRQFTVGEKNFSEEGLYVQPEFLKIFSFPLLSGDAGNVLSEPRTVLLTQSLAAKYFGSENPIGKTITIEQNLEYKVVGVLEDVPSNSTIRFNYLMPMKDYVTDYMDGEERWYNANIRAYVKLKAGIERDKFEKEFAGILPKYTNEQEGVSMFLFNLKDWYLRNDFKDGRYAGGGRIIYVNLFTIIAFLILMLACINFMNLSTARATHRAKEVGVRKVIGAGRPALIKQFISESMLLSVIAGFIALVLVWISLPYFNDFLRKQISIEYSSITNISVFVGIIFITGVLAGSYPAFVLSAFQPVKVLKNALTPSASNAAWVRKTLVVTQFTVSVLLIIGTVVISQQIKFVQSQHLGYDKENLIWFNNNIPVEKSERVLIELKKVPGVLHAAQSSNTFTYSNNRSENVKWPGKTEGQDIFFSFITAGNEVVPAMGLKIQDGRDFIPGNKADTNSILLNEEAVKRMGLKNPVGQEIELFYGKVTVAGVVKDFHLESLHNPITPVIIQCRPDWTWVMYVRTDGKSTEQTLKGIERVYKSLAPGFVFDYNFQDKEYERLYRSENQISILINWFTFFAIFISCLGLLGLTSYSIERRKKEIGIRKVLGASVASIASLVSKQFVGLVLIAIILAIAPAYYFMNNWLNGFAYRITLSTWMFAAAGGMALFIAILTVVSQTVNAALINPIKSLRTE